MDPNEKIQLDDITFDDVIAGDGLEVMPEPEVAPLEESPSEIEETEEPTLDDLAIDDDEEEEEEEYDENEDDEEEDSDEDPEEYEVDEEDGSDSIVAEVLSKLGYDLEEGSYEDTPEGLANMTTDIASEMADERIDEVLEAFPLVKKHLDYVLAGGQSQNFMEAYDPNLDYDKVQIDQDDHRSQKAILGDYLELKGHDNDFIEEMLNDFEDTGKLYAKAEAARGALAKHQTAKRDQLITQQREATNKQEEKLTEFWNGVADTIEESAEFAGINVPDRDKNKFFEYLSTPVTQEGQTQRDIDHQDADMDIKLAIDYLMYKGFDLGGLVETKAKTQNARSLKDRISRNEESVKSTRRSSRRKGGNVDLENLDLSL